MRRAWPLLALTVLAGGCGQKGPLYLPDKGGKVVTTAPAAIGAQPAAPAAAPADSPPPGGEPAVAPTPKPTDKDKDQDSQPPK